MKRIKYLIITAFLMLLGTGVVDAAANVTVPSTFEVTVGEQAQIPVTLTDIIAIMDITSSNSDVVRVDTATLDEKTDGPGTVNKSFSITGLAEGTTTITITSSDSAEFSSGEEYNFPTKTITVTVKAAAAEQPGRSEEPAPSDTPTTPTTSETGEGSTTTTSETTPKNPKTGVADYLFAILGVLAIGVAGYVVVGKKGQFNRI